MFADVIKSRSASLARIWSTNAAKSQLTVWCAAAHKCGISTPPPSLPFHQDVTQFYTSTETVVEMLCWVRKSLSHFKSVTRNRIYEQPLRYISAHEQQLRTTCNLTPCNRSMSISDESRMWLANAITTCEMENKESASKRNCLGQSGTSRKQQLYTFARQHSKFSVHLKY